MASPSRLRYRCWDSDVCHVTFVAHTTDNTTKQGPRRGFSVFDAAQLGECVVAEICAPESPGIVMGTITASFGKLGGPQVAAMHSAAYSAALKRGKELAAMSKPLYGHEGLTPGMRYLDTSSWNDRNTSLPGWIWMLNMPRSTQNPRFVEAIVRCAADHRGVTNVDDLADAAIQDVARGGETPTEATLHFAMLVAQSMHMAVTTARWDMLGDMLSPKPPLHHSGVTCCPPSHRADTSRTLWIRTSRTGRGGRQTSMPPSPWTRISRRPGATTARVPQLLYQVSSTASSRASAAETVSTMQLAMCSGTLQWHLILVLYTST